MNQLEFQRVADIPTGAFQDLEEQLMTNIIKHCKDWGQPIATDSWLMKKLAEIGKLNQENIKIIARATGLSQEAIEVMLEEVAGQIIGEIEPAMQQVAKAGLAGEAVPVEQSRNVKQVVKTMHKQAKDVLNLCNTTMLYMARDAYQSLVQNIASTADEIAQKQEFIDVLNKHATAAVIGAESRQQALRKCIKEFNDRGIPAFVDKRGRKWTPEAYVNMAMRTTSNTMAAEIQMARVDDFGIDLVQVDSHSGARPKCAKDQGKIFDRANKSEKYPHWNTSSYGEPDGLLGINCGHHIFPFIEGVNVRRYFPTEDMDANDKLYKQTQIQRSLERDVRKQKRECMLLDQAGDKEGFEEAAVKLKAKEAKLKEYVSANPDLHRRRDREQVVGFDKRISAEAIAAKKNSIRISSEESQYREYLKSLKAGKVTLRSSQKKLLDKVPEVGNWTEVRKKQIITKDLAALTAATGHEFAIFEGPNSKIIIHGTSKSWHIPHEAWEVIKANHYEWTAHSHPTLSKLQASVEDRKTLKLFTWQEKSTIIDLNGKTIEFTADEQDWFNEMLGVVDHDKQRRGEEYRWPDDD